MKRSRNFFTSVALVALAGSIVSPAGAERSPIPAKPNIIDPAGDANFLNPVDQPTPVQVEGADLLAVWFEADSRYVTVKWHIAASPRDQGIVLTSKFVWDPSQGLPPDYDRYIRISTRCMEIAAYFFNPALDTSEPEAEFYDRCTYPDGTYFSSRPSLRLLQDGTAIVSASFKRSSSPFFKAGALLSHPYGGSSIHVGHEETGGVISMRVDTTVIGRDFRMP